MSADENMDRLVAAREQLEQLLLVLNVPLPPAAAGRLVALGRTLGIDGDDLAAALGAARSPSSSTPECAHQIGADEHLCGIHRAMFNPSGDVGRAFPTGPRLVR